MLSPKNQLNPTELRKRPRCEYRISSQKNVKKIGIKKSILNEQKLPSKLFSNPLFPRHLNSAPIPNYKFNLVLYVLDCLRNIIKGAVTTLFLLFCSQAIISLTHDFLKRDVKETISTDKSDKIEPPNFSFCFNILGFINSTALFNSRPDIRRDIDKYLETCQYCPDHDEHMLISDPSEGAKFVFGRLTVAEIMHFVPEFSSILETCYYLNTDLFMKKCDVSFFRPYIYNHLTCFEFIWYSTLSGQQHPPSFQTDAIKIPGFQNSRFIRVDLNLTLINSSQLTVMAHSSREVPWNLETGLQEIKITHDQSVSYELSYRKTTKYSLESPFQSNCSSFNGPIYWSRQQCLNTCSAGRFINLTGKYPRYYVVKKFDKKYLTYSYTEREIYQPLIQQLSELCLPQCKVSDCFDQFYDLFSLTKKIQFFPGRRITRVLVYPPTQPDTVMRTVATHNFAQFFGSLGGTIGIWFGFSAYSTIQFINNAMPRTLHQIKSYWEKWQNRQLRPTIIKFKTNIQPVK